MLMNSDTLAKLDRLQLEYILALDSTDMDAWLATFSPAGSYICSTAEADEAGLPVALILDDCYARLEDRVKFVDRVWAGTVHKYRTRHLVQRLSCKANDAGRFDVFSNFVVAYSRSDTKTTELYAAGRYIDEIEIVGEKAFFRSKRAVMDADYLKHYLVYPM